LEEALDSTTRSNASGEKGSHHKPLNNVSTTSSSVGCSDEVLDTMKDVVIYCNINEIPLSVLSVIKLMRGLGVKVLTKFYFHSSLKWTSDSHSDYLNKTLSLIDFNSNSDESGVEKRLDNHLIISFIFKEISEHQMIVTSNQSIPIASEANILRFVARIGAKLRPELSSLYEGIEDISRLTVVDNFVDEINTKLFVESDKQSSYYSQLDSHLSRNKYLSAISPSIADLLLFSRLNHRSDKRKLSTNLEKWFQSMRQFIGAKH